MKQLTKEEAIEFYESGKWEDWPDRALVGFQLFQRRLCIPFEVFHAATEKVLGRPVWTHEFGSVGHLVAEYLGQAPKPSLEDIMNLVPEEKRIIVVYDDQRDNR
jgi:hypothetical protein